jgi:hypothetical protein
MPKIALKAGLARVLKHLAAIDLEALAKLEVGPLDFFLEKLFSLTQPMRWACMFFKSNRLGEPRSAQQISSVNPPL